VRYTSILFLRQGRNALKQFKFRNISISVIAINLYLIAQFKKHICETSICTETDNTRSALSRASYNINQFQLICPLINTVDLDLVNSIIYCAEIFIIRSRTYTVYVRTEVTLCNTSKTSVDNTSKASILMSVYNRYLSIMITCYVKIFAIYVCSKEAASHAININAVDTCQIAIMITLEYRNTLILDRIKIFSILGYCGIRRITYFHFTSLCESTFFQVHVINLNSFAGSVSIGSYISHIFLTHLSSLLQSLSGNRPFTLFFRSFLQRNGSLCSSEYYCILYISKSSAAVHLLQPHFITATRILVSFM